MNAGRELDALVYQRVMNGPFTDLSPQPNCEECGTDTVNCQVHHYSTDIAAAWLVVEKLVSAGNVFIVKGDGLRTGDWALKWTVLCDNQPRTDAETAPLAICLAALKAVGVEVEE